MRHNIKSAVDSLQKKADCKLSKEKEIIEVLVPNSTHRRNDLGNGSWGGLTN